MPLLLVVFHRPQSQLTRIGYLAIYLLGLATGGHILHYSRPSDPNTVQTASQKQEHRAKRRTELALALLSRSVESWGVLLLFRLCGVQISRRMVRAIMAYTVGADLQANMPYVFWTAAFNTTFLLGYLVLEIMSTDSDFATDNVNPVPPLLDAINQNGLIVFLMVSRRPSWVATR
jgi:phosphatidylinositol glycan class W